MDLRRIKSCPELFICPCHQYFLRSFLCWDSPICVSHELHLYVLVFLLCVRPGMLSSLWKGLWLFGGCFAEVYFGWFREGAGKRQQMSRATSPLCFHWAGSKSLIRKQCPVLCLLNYFCPGNLTPASCKSAWLLWSVEIICVSLTPLLLMKMAPGRRKVALLQIQISHSSFFTESVVKTSPHLPSHRVHGLWKSHPFEISSGLYVILKWSRNKSGGEEDREKCSFRKPQDVPSLLPFQAWSKFCFIWLYIFFFIFKWQEKKVK